MLWIRMRRSPVWRAWRNGVGIGVSAVISVAGGSGSGELSK